MKKFEMFKIWAQDVNLNKLHRVLIAFIIVCFGLTLGITVVVESLMPSAQSIIASTTGMRSTSDSSSLMPGEYLIYQVNKSDPSKIMLVLSKASGGIVFSVSIPPGQDVTDFIDNYCMYRYRLSVDNAGKWNFIHE